LKNIEDTTDIQKKALLWHKRYLQKAQSFWGSINSNADVCLILDKKIEPLLLSWKEKYRRKEQYYGLVIPCLEMGHYGDMSIDLIKKAIKINTY
jgi:hypothetical protein